jgi:diguanylate cyclase (GGDEF)-like protein/PAS domain S-box-containing protein
MDVPVQPLLANGPLPAAGRPVLIVWLFAGIVICMLGLTVYSAQLLSAGRALVALESSWARAQKDAVFHLTRYASRGAEQDYRAYERSIATIEGARSARHALRSPEPDLAVVRSGLRASGVHASEVDGLTTLFTRLSGFEPMAYILAQWGRSDLLMEELRAVGERIRSAGGNLAPAQAERLIQRVHSINTTLSTLEDDLAQALADIQRAAQSWLTSGILVISGILLVGGISLSRRFLAQNDRLQRSLAANESQLRSLVEGAPLPLLIARASDQQLLYANEQALSQLALDAQGALARSLADFHVDPATRDKVANVLSRHGSVRDFEVQLKDIHGHAFWMLLSAQPMRYAGVNCLLVALANIDDRKRLQDDMRRKAMHDPLTGLPNRAMFMESLERAVHMARRRSVRFSVLFIDLDRFKEVNDTMGHQAGDTLLRIVSQRLLAAVRQSDLVARLGGDEFVVLVEEHGGPEEVMIVAQKVVSMLARPVPVDVREAEVSGSIGIASYPEDGADVDTLVQNADAAMYQAKERGRNNFQFYSPEMNLLSHRRFEQEKRMRGALERDEFFLEYQPEIDLASGRISAVEALLRWRDAVHGVMTPAMFMPLAEETGTAWTIGAWALGRALSDFKAWARQSSELRLAINLSEKMLLQPALVDEIARLLAVHAVAPQSLRVEIPEPTLMHDSEVLHRNIRALHELGTEIAIDNFGTGYSSLGLVRGLPIQVVKIDRSLVSACPVKRECSAIVEATAAMAKALGIRVVAQGVETDEQRRHMARLGCDAIQGYLPARPMDAAAIAEMTSAVAEQTFFA